jgi:hypothetical protein
VLVLGAANDAAVGHDAGIVADTVREAARSVGEPMSMHPLPRGQLPTSKGCAAGFGRPCRKEVGAKKWS